MNFAFGNAQHVGARTSQQDAFGFSDPADAEFVRHGGFCAVVCDGMGGMAFGDLAARTAIRTFLEAYQAKSAWEPIPVALNRGLDAANRAVVEQARAADVLGDMGTTIVAAVIHGSWLHWISVGDSGLFLYREGELAQLNTPHTFAADLDRKASEGRLSWPDALAHPERESLTAYVGNPQAQILDRTLRPFPLDADDCILLASDGLFKTLNPAEIVGAMRGSFQERCDTLVRAVLERRQEQQDNVTVLAIGHQEQAPAPFLPAPPPVTKKKRRGLRLALTALLMALAGGGALWLGLNRMADASPPRPPLPASDKSYEIDKRDARGPRAEPAVPAEVRP